MSGQSLVTPGLRDRVRGMAEPVARGFGRLGLTPNHLTFIGFGIAIIAAGAAATQNWLAAGLLVIGGGVFDLFDGSLARATGKASKLGAFYDSVFDRWGEGVIYVGIAWGCVVGGFWQGGVLAAAALSAAVMVSYARAKSEGLGFTQGTGMASVGLAPREVRIVILTTGLLVAGMLGGFTWKICDSGFGPPPCAADDPRGAALALGLTLSLITILSTITVIQRILHVRKQAAEDRA